MKTSAKIISVQVAWVLELALCVGFCLQFSLHSPQIWVCMQIGYHGTLSYSMFIHFPYLHSHYLEYTLFYQTH